MTSVQIQKLLQPPDRTVAIQRAVSVLNSSFTSLDQVKANGKLDSLLSESASSSSALRERVRSRLLPFYALTHLLYPSSVSTFERECGRCC